MNILVAGCGKTGAALAGKLAEYGHDIAVIDENGSNFDNLPEGFGGLAFEGIPIDSDALVKAGIKTCDVVAAVTSDDNINLMVAQLAKEVFGVKRVIARVSDKEKEQIYSSFGLTTVCPTNLTVDSLASAVDEFSHNESYIRMGNHTVRFFSMAAPAEFIGKKALGITLEQDEILYAVINAEGEMRLVTNYNFVINSGDTLVFSKLVD
ncbi:MAG: potassium channel family protein [Ruminiclostridium sp.]